MADRIVQVGDCKSQGCRDWVRAGRPWTLAPSPRALQVAVGGYGFTVYAFPDFSHLVASTPEDHTSFSATGWPTPAPRWFGNADDIMPRGDTPAARQELEALARQIIADKDAGVPGTAWIKYLNWTEASGKCWHTSWEPNKRTVTSSDKGHIHVSGRSDWAIRAAAPYDPVARMRGASMAGEGDEPVANSWLEALTQGTEGYAGQQRDTALAFAWKSANEANEAARQTLAIVTEMAKHIDIDPAELERITAAAKAGTAAAFAEQADAWAQAVVAKLAQVGVGSAATHDQMVAAVREVLLTGAGGPSVPAAG